MSPEPLIILAVIIFIVVLACHLLNASRRRKELAAFAAEHGLSFDEGKDRGKDDRYVAFKCLRRGRSRYAYNIMSGQLHGLTMEAFDYHYVTGSGKNRRTHRFSALIASSPVPLRPLLIRRENIFDKVTEFFGLDDIDFESAEFSNKFFVKSSDRRWAFDVIHQRTMDYLLNAPPFSIQFDESSIIAWRSSRFSPGDFDSACVLIKGILDLLPDYLFRK